MKNKSDFDDLVRAINLNIMNSYTKFRNKKDLDFSAFDKKPEEHPSGKKTKLESKDIPKGEKRVSEPLGSREGEFSFQRGGKKQRLVGDQRIYGSRRTEHAKPTKVGDKIENIASEKDKPKDKTPPVKNPYRQDEKGKYVRGTGYAKPVTGGRSTPHKQRRNVAGDPESKGLAYEAKPATRTRDRHEKLDQNRIGAGDDKQPAGKKQRIHGEDRTFGIETQDPLPPHKHLRHQDPKTGEVVRDRYATNPRNVKWEKGGRKRDRKEAETAVRQGMQNLKGTGISYNNMKGIEKLKADLDELAHRIKENIEGFTPAKETFGDKRWRVPQIKQPKGEKEQAESKRRSDLSRDQWVKDFAMHYTSPKMQQEKESKEWQKKKMALLKAFLSPIVFRYKKKTGHTYERGQTKNVETQDHSRTGNTNNKQMYEADKDDLTIKSLDEIYNAFKNGKKE